MELDVALAVSEADGDGLGVEVAAPDAVGVGVADSLPVSDAAGNVLGVALSDDDADSDRLGSEDVLPDADAAIVRLVDGELVIGTLSDGGLTVANPDALAVASAALDVVSDGLADAVPPADALRDGLTDTDSDVVADDDRVPVGAISCPADCDDDGDVDGDCDRDTLLDGDIKGDGDAAAAKLVPPVRVQIARMTALSLSATYKTPLADIVRPLGWSRRAEVPTASV